MSDVRRERGPGEGTPRDTGDRAPEVDQVVFRWGGNQGRQGTGMTAVARSCPPGRAEELGRELGALLWVTGSSDPRPSIVRTISPDGAVLLVQRRPTTDPSGRPSTVSHVLTGPAGTLPPRMCLGLAYGGWGRQDKTEQASGPQETVPVARLQKAAQPYLAEMGQRLPEVQRALSLVTAEWLRDPRTRVSLLVDGVAATGWPDRSAVPLVYYGLFLLFHGWLPGRWTFATYDTVDTHPLRLTCVPRWELDAGATGSLARVAPGPVPDDAEHEIAARLVARLLAYGPDGPPGPELARLLPYGADLSWERRRERLEEALGDGPRGIGPRRGAASPTGPARDRASGRDLSSRLLGPLPELGEPGTDDPHDLPPGPGGQEPLPPQAAPFDPREDSGRGPASVPPSQPPIPQSSIPQSPPSQSPIPQSSVPRQPSTAQAAGGRPLHAALCSTDLTGVPLLLRSPADEELVRELGFPDLPMEAVHLVLDELAERSRVRGLRPETRHALCTEVLRGGLYLGPSRHRWSKEPAELPHLVARAAELFAWAVAPLARDRRHHDDLLRLAELITRDPHGPLGFWFHQCLLALPGDEAPDLPPAVWQTLLRDAYRAHPAPPAAAQVPPPGAGSPVSGPAAPGYGTPAAGHGTVPDRAPGARGATGARGAADGAGGARPGTAPSGGPAPPPAPPIPSSTPASMPAPMPAPPESTPPESPEPAPQSVPGTAPRPTVRPVPVLAAFGVVIVLLVGTIIYRILA